MAISMNMPEAIGAKVKIRHLVKHYGNVLAVDSISLGIQPGELVTHMGPSGSGKTTTLMMIAGFEIPASGWHARLAVEMASLPLYFPVEIKMVVKLKE